MQRTDVAVFSPVYYIFLILLKPPYFSMSAYSSSNQHKHTQACFLWSSFPYKGSHVMANKYEINVYACLLLTCFCPFNFQTQRGHWDGKETLSSPMLAKCQAQCKAQFSKPDHEKGEKETVWSRGTWRLLHTILRGSLDIFTTGKFLITCGVVTGLWCDQKLSQVII